MQEVFSVLMPDSPELHNVSYSPLSLETHIYMSMSLTRSVEGAETSSAKSHHDTKSFAMPQHTPGYSHMGRDRSKPINYHVPPLPS